MVRQRRRREEDVALAVKNTKTTEEAEWMCVHIASLYKGRDNLKPSISKAVKQVVAETPGEPWDTYRKWLNDIEGSGP